MLANTAARCSTAVNSLQYVRCASSIKEKAGEMLQKAGQAFTDQGKVGKQFNPDHPDGSAGKSAQEAGEEGTGAANELKKDGKVGKQFTSDGAVGGTAEKAGKKAAETGAKMKREG